MNKVLRAFRSWDERQENIGLIGTAKEDQQVINRLKLAHFQQCRHQLSQTISAEERPFLPLLHNAIGRLEKQVHPNLLTRLFFKIKDRFFDRPAYIRRSQQQWQDNVAGIKRQLDKTGLGSFSGDLEKQLKSGLPIHLSCQLDQDRTLKVALHFAKDANDNFRFTRIDAGIGSQSHQFKLSEWPGIDTVQVKNLLEGRAIKQDYADLSGKRNSRWLELAPDGQVKQYLRSYGFEPEKLLTDARFYNKENLLRELEKGNKIQLSNGYLQADPATASIKAFDKAHKEVALEHFNKPEKQQAVIKQLPKGVERKKQVSIKM